MMPDPCPCTACTLSAYRRKTNTVLPYHVNAYRFVLEVVLHCFEKVARRGVHSSDIKASAKTILDAHISYSRQKFGSLARMTFDVLGIRTSKDVARIMQDLVDATLLDSNPSEEDDRFDRYDIDFLKELSLPEEKGIP